MIVLFTDFGLHGPYVGQMKAAIARDAPAVTIIDLFADAPAFDARLAAYLLAAYMNEFPLDTVFLCVVDPGVGGERAPVIVRADGRWFVGPDNGLFNAVANRARHVQCWDITYKPGKFSASFHGRDIFAPVAARLACNTPPPGQLRGATIKSAWPDDLPNVIYIDHYGNCFTGLRASQVAESAVLRINAHALRRARTFSDVPIGAGFWYENSVGLVEIAVNQGHAARVLGIALGAEIALT